MAFAGTRHGLRRWYRRTFLKLAGAATTLTSGVGAAEAQEAVGGEHVGTPDQTGGGDAMQASQRIDTARRVSPRDLDSRNYERLYTNRKKDAIEVLLEDPAVNVPARSWIASFQAHEPLTNHLDMVSVQGPKDLQIEGGLDTGTFSITAVSRQGAYGVVDRYTNELVALTVNEPADVSWEESYDEAAIQRGRVVTGQPEVQSFLEGRQWYPAFKVAESITAYRDFRHGQAGPVALHVRTDDGLTVLSAFVDATDPQNVRFLHATTVGDYVEFPVHEMARDIRPRTSSVLGEVPSVPMAARPYYTANDGFHRIDAPPESFQQNDWRITWRPPTTQGITIAADFNGRPAFAALDNPATYTGYMLPPREGRSQSDWYFPTDEPVFSGELLFWDIHSTEFGGPGMLAKIDYPETARYPGGFRLKTHYHTGSQGRSSVDFHSGMQLGPYNYDISHEFFGDGVVRPIWRRHGPGYVTEHLQHDRQYGEGEETVVQHYTSATAVDVTPGTTDGVRTQLFDGNAWSTSSEELYVQGEPGMKVRFANPNGPERIDIPLDRDTEIVVVRRKQNEIGPGDATGTRVQDAGAEQQFYHPSQYADGEPIQGERVIVWLMLEAATGQMPRFGGITSFAAPGELQLGGYE